MFKLDLEKAEEPEIKWPASTGSFNKQESSRKTSTFALLTMPKPWHIPFQILNQSFVPCVFLTIVSWPAYRFLRRQLRWSGIPIYLRIFKKKKRIFQFVVIHIAKGLSIIIETEVDAFLEFFCFFYKSVDVGNLISGCSAFSKSSLYIWKFLVHVLLEPSLKDFENYFASV